MLHLFASVHASSVGVVLPLGKVCQELKFVYLDLKHEYPHTESSANLLFGYSAHPEKCETC